MYDSASSPASADVDHNVIRLEIARTLVERKRRELGPQAIAGACYGSVAHGAATAYSDVELLIVMNAGVEGRDEMLFERGVMVECNIIPGSHLLQAAQRVTANWGIQADEYRHQYAIWDPEGFFPRLREGANKIPDESFEKALRENWHWFYESRTKTFAALEAADLTRAVYDGWLFAFTVAMRIALHERKPYESGRTLWRDVRARGYSMERLTDVLTQARFGEIREAIDIVWGQVGHWGAPEGVESILSGER
jgi:kanamycin nucleotidyltransferase